MRTIATFACVVAAALAPAAGATAKASPPASVRMTACHLGLASDQRAATFDADMKAVPNTSTMKVRFTLFQRTPGSPTSVVQSPELQQWRSSREGVGSFSYAQTVNGLQSGSDYNVSVAYRWLDAHGHVIAHASRRSHACIEVGPIAELRLMDLTAAAGSDASSELYTFDLYNGSAVTEPPATVSLSVDHGAPVKTSLGKLRAGQSRRFTLAGPACAHRLRLAVSRGAFPHETTSDVGGCPSTS